MQYIEHGYAGVAVKLSGVMRNSSALAAVLCVVSGGALAQGAGDAISSSSARSGDFRIETVVVTGTASP